MNHFGENSNWKVVYHPAVKKDIKSLNKNTCEKIKNAIERKLTVNPLLYGMPLYGTLNKYFKFRIGDFRIIYEIHKDKIIIILVIANRKDVYSLASRRIK